MSKFLTVVLLMLASSFSFAQDSNYSSMVKTLVRNKLWYEGITAKNSVDFNQLSKKPAKQLPEELEVAIQKMAEIDS
tara:strand:+ start:294 stop:524 length:231 start_codon:yes stop_codon:yes gene_type:complete